MPRYMVERSVPRGFGIWISEDGSKAVQAVVDANSRGGRDLGARVPVDRQARDLLHL
jgi:hypothetical protein